MKGTFQLLGAFAAAHVVSATNYEWNQPFAGSKQFTPPAYCNNKCTTKQTTGYDFSDAPLGNLPSYDDFGFTGYTCKNSGLQRRTGGGSGSKCASSHVEPKNYGNEISCSKEFSVHEIHISVEVESVVEFTYGMPDGSSCKQVSKCGTEITPIQNTQCGGAKSVKCRIHESSGNQKKCGFNVHHVKFYCDDNSGTTSAPAPTTTAAVDTTSACTDYTCTAGTTTAPAGTTTAPAVVDTTSVCTDYTCTAGTTAAVDTTSVCTDYTCTAGTTTAAVDTTSVCTDYTCTAGTTTAPAGTTTAPAVVDTTSVCTDYTCTAATTAAVDTTSVCTDYTCTAASAATSAPCTDYSCTGAPTGTNVYVQPTTTPNVYVPPMNTTAPYVQPSDTNTLPPSGTDVYTTMPSVPVETGCPQVLPQCMQVWTKITQCIDSGDVKCLCPNAEYIQNVASCVEAWGSDDSEVAKALEYMQGLCADHIPSNPAIVTCVPTYVTLPPASTGATTITVSTTVVVPCTNVAASVTTAAGYTPSYTTQVVATTVTVCPVKLVTTVPNKPVLVPATVTAPPYVPVAPSSVPATVPVQYTTPAYVPVPTYVPTTMATAYPTGSYSGNGTTPYPPVATGAGSSVKVFTSLMAGAFIGVAALIVA
ncbi:hypothetical protein TWF694_007817 [Orbilia ellipsospora]|uniref:CFEM domain-containing protein n=1 Tax=Orbilia ellipsospora TaxID=2528407 RepID=A0AAV9XIU6_9PEZI